MKKIKNILWKTYYFLLVFLCVSMVFFVVGLSFLGEENIVFSKGGNMFSDAYEIISVIIFLFSIIGIRGYIYKKRYFSNGLWVVIFILLFIETIGSSISDYNIVINNGYYLFALGLSLIHLYALWKYSFKMNYLWKGSSHD